MGFILYILYIDNVFLINISVASRPITGTTLASSRLFCQMSTRAHVWKFPSIYPVWSGLNWTCRTFPSACARSLDGTGPKWTRRGLGCCVGKAKRVSVKANPAEKNEWAARQERKPTGSQAYTITHTRTRACIHARTGAWL